MLLLTAEPISASSEIQSPTPLLDLAASPADPLTVVTALFRHILEREADEEGLVTWRTHLEHDVPVRTVAKAMANSPEFAKLPRPHRDSVLQQLASWDATSWLAELGLWPREPTYHEGRVSDEIFVRALFEVAFHQVPDAPSLAHELSRLDAGIGRESMLRAFAANPAVQRRFGGTGSTGLRGVLRRRRDKYATLETFRLLVVLAEGRQVADMLGTVKFARLPRGGSK